MINLKNLNGRGRTRKNADEKRLSAFSLFCVIFALAVFQAACRNEPSDVVDAPASYPVEMATPTDLGTGVFTSTPSPAPYLAPEQAETAVSIPSSIPEQIAEATFETFLPFVGNGEVVTAVPSQTPRPSPTPVPSPTPIPTVDFAAVRAELLENGQELATVKIGFHVGVGGNSEGLEEWMRALDAAGVPFFLKSVDNAQPILLGQELMKASGVPHVLVFRKRAGDEYDWDVPNYDLPPQQAAEIHWQMHRDSFPPELDPSLVWVETINEVDRNRSEWLAEFAMATSAMAIRDGFNWAAFGFSSGEPESEHWQGPKMLEFLRFAGDNPDRVAIALHEYSYLRDDIGDAYPYKIGRFQELLRIVDSYRIPRPTILITEWGWTYETVPSRKDAIEDIAWASSLYAQYPSVKGAAIWYLGSGFSHIANAAQKLITPVTEYSLQNYFARPQTPGPVDVESNRP